MNNLINEMERITGILKQSDKGMDITQLSSATRLHRNSVAKYLHLLQLLGYVDLRYQGRNKIFSLSSRIPFSSLTRLDSMVIGVDNDMNIIHVSPQILKNYKGVFDHSVQTNVKNIPSPLFHDPRTIQMIKGAIQGEDQLQVIETVIDNLPSCVELKCIPAIFSDGRTGAALILKEDHQAKKTSYNVDYWKKQYEEYFKDIEEFVVSHLPDGTILFANEAYCSAFGITLSEVVGTKSKPIIPTEDQTALSGHFSSLSSKKLIAEIEHRIVFPDGSVRWYRWKNRCYCQDENVVRIHSIGSDITDRKLKEDQLIKAQNGLKDIVEESSEEWRKINHQLMQEMEKRQKTELVLKLSEKRYREIVESQAELVCRWKPDGTITFVNEAICRYMGIPRDQFLGQNCLKYLPPEDQVRVIAHIPSMTPTNPHSQITHRIIHPATGEIRWQQWYCTTFFASDGTPIEYQSVGRDSTDLMRIAEARVPANHSHIAKEF